MTAGEPPHAELPEDLSERAADQIIAVTGAARTAVLDALIAAHPRYEAGLRRLCAELSGAERLLACTYPGLDDESPTHIGGHCVLQRLGEGAFGIVYLCAQEHPVVRQVAVKVLRPGAGDDKTLRRFAAERQLLAALNHPSITQVFDAGVLPDGRPFFVMEYVDGATFRQYCERAGLSRDDRLRLFVDLCRGVAHAHSRGIVHRDLKPGNVLVVDGEAGPLPKIIDFGIAKALSAPTDGEGPRTDAGRVIGTPGYMSPEQAAGRTDEIDARADVFALGVMLYELLTDALPWDQGAAATDTEPQRPSARVGSSTHGTHAVEPTSRRRLAAALRGDLDWITLKALARERSDRYATVTALAADIERHLRGEPVSVGPPKTSYRLRKFVRRNRALVATCTTAAVVLGIGLSAALRYGSEAEAAVVGARKEAATSLADATAVVDQLLARANDPRLREAPRGDAARQALLQDALSFYERFLRNRPEDARLRAGRCRALLAIAHVHWLLGEPSRAGKVAAEAKEDADALLAAAPGNLEYRGLLGRALSTQGNAYALAGNHKAAQPLFAAAVQELAGCAAAEPATYGRAHAAALREAAETLGPDLAEQRLAGLQACLRVLDNLRHDLPQLAGVVDDHVQACIGLAVQLEGMRRYEAADAALDTAAAELPQVTAERQMLTHQVLRQQGRVAWERGLRPAAVQLCQRAVEVAAAWQQEQPQRMLPQEFLAMALQDLGTCQNYTGDFAASYASFRRSIAVAEATVQQFPDEPSRLVRLCAIQRRFARTLWDSFRRETLDEAATCAARATTVNDRIPYSVDAGRQPRWQLLAMQAVIEDSRGHTAADPLWPQVEAALPIDAATRAQQDQDLLVEACTGLARWHFYNGERDAAANFLLLARERIAADRPHLDKRMVEVGWLEARLAAARGDHTEAAAAADRILVARPTWFGTKRAADCLRLAARCSTELPAAAAADYRARAKQLYGDVIDSLREDVAKDPQDPWYVLPWGFASVRLAEFEAVDDDAAQALERLAAALPKLDGVHAAAHADLWEEDTVQAGRQLQVQLTATPRGR